MAPAAAVPAAPMYKVPDIGVVAIGAGAALVVSLVAAYFALGVVAGAAWGLAAAAVAMVLGARRRARLAHAFQLLCARRGWRFSEKAPPELVPSFGIVGPFGRGHGRTASFLVTGPGGFQAFQYTYYTKSGGRRRDSRRYHHFCVASLTMPLKAPQLTIAPETFRHKIFDALGAEDIDFEDDSFSRQWWVRCRDRRFAYDVLHPRAMGFLQAQHREFSWICEDRRLVVFRSGGITPDDVEALHASATGFVALLPRHLLAAQATPVWTRSRGQPLSSPGTTGTHRGP